MPKCNYNFYQKHMITFNEFVNKYLGRYVGNFPGTTDPNQCMDLMRFYIREVWGVDPYVIPRAGTAKQAWNLAKTNTSVIKIPNTPNGIPKKGDICFLGTYPGITGWAGHVGMVWEADLYNVTLFQLNYPTGNPCNFRRFKYIGLFKRPIILGWISRR